jgi:drug/metabolite transporter (DMT)-like permease
MTLASIVAQIFMTMGIQRETASRATNVFFLGVVLAVIWGQVLGDPPLQPLDWAGALLICASIVALALARGRGPTLGRMA